MSTSAPAIQYGNLEGQYFTQWRIEMLEELLRYTVHGFCDIQRPIEVTDVNIWYDGRMDYHMLSFKSDGHSVVVRLYKGFSCEIDGEDGWVGCPKGQIIEFANSIRKKISEDAAQ